MSDEIKVELPMTDEQKMEAEIKTMVHMKDAAEAAYTALDLKVKELFTKYGEKTFVYEEAVLGDDKKFTRVAFIDNVKKLQEEGSCFHATSLKAVAIKVDRLKNLPK